MTLREQVFRKMGAELEVVKTVALGIKYWAWMLNGQQISSEYARGKDEKPGYLEGALPYIDSQWEVCGKYLVPFMRERKFQYNIESGTHFWWLKYQESIGWHVRDTLSEIKDDNIAEAACKAFMEVSIDGYKD